MRKQLRLSSAGEKTAANLRSPSKPPGYKASIANPTTKAEKILSLLRRSKGASVNEMAGATGWQNHSIRGFLSGELKRKRSLTVLSERVDGVLRYRIAKGA